MSRDDVAGKVSVTSDGDTIHVVWKIPGNCSLGYVSSPDFGAFHSKWQINFVTSSTVVIHLERRDSGSPKTIDYTWGFKKANGSFQEGPHGRNMFVEKGEYTFDIAELQRDVSELMPWSTLTITCRMRLVDGAEDTQWGCAAEQAPQLKEGTTSKSDAEQRGVKRLRTLSQNLKHLYRESLGCDVRIRVGLQVFEAHKAILMARIPAFADMFGLDGTVINNSTITLDDCHPEVFEEFLLFLYSGELENLSDLNVRGLFDLANKYDLQELREECAAFMSSKFTLHNIFDILAL